MLFTYLHLAADKVQTDGLIRSGATCIAYETVTDRHGGLPLLSPMSEVAGRMSVQVGAHCLEREQGGAGILLGGVPGVPPARVVVIGGGVAGTNAARMAVGLEASVIILDRSLPRLKELDLQFGPRASTEFATAEAIERAVLDADLVIGAVLVPGAAAPKLVTRAMLKRMRPGSVLVDIAIDQGGCFETSRPTTHSAPTYVEDGVVHYCVTNMPGAVARTSTFALTNATLAVRHRAGREGLARRAARRSASARWAECARGAGHLRGGGARPRDFPISRPRDCSPAGKFARRINSSRVWPPLQLSPPRSPAVCDAGRLRRFAPGLHRPCRAGDAGGRIVLWPNDRTCLSA